MLFGVEETEDLNEELLGFMVGYPDKSNRTTCKDLPIPTFEHVDHWLTKPMVSGIMKCQLEINMKR